MRSKRNSKTFSPHTSNAETGQRGFIITGEERYLESYDAGIARIQQDIDALARLIRDASQQETLQEVRKLSDAKLAELRETIRLRKEPGLQGICQSFSLTAARRSWTISGTRWPG